MAFDYGKDTLGIKNPFKLEGLLVLLKGIIITALGILLIFDVRSTLEVASKSTAWIELGAAILFLLFGLKFLAEGSIKLFRFLVGRSVPSDLSPDPYASEQMAEMLMKRINPTFAEKSSYVSRLVISIFHKFLFLPVGFRVIVEGITAAALETALALALFLLALFSTSIGLITFHDAGVVTGWLGLALIVYLFFIWMKYRPTNKRINSHLLKTTEISTLVLLIVIVILVPALTNYLIGKGVNVPSLNIPIVLYLFLFLAFSVVAVIAVYWLSYYRANEANPDTSVSEYKEHLQFNMHPKDLFRCFELEMTHKRYKEIPNRTYLELKPILELEGSQNKGSFEGDTIQETQPVVKTLTYPRNFYTLRLIVCAVGHMLAVVAYLILFFNISDLSSDVTFRSVLSTLFYPALFFLFSTLLANSVHYFYSEILFSSYLVHFFADGTYTESRISTGMSVYDSNRSENTIIRTSATPWLLVSEIVSSTFADSTTNNLEGKRYVMEMYKADVFRDEIVNGIKYYLENRELLADIDSKKDLDNTAKYYKINEATRSKMRDNPEKFREIDSDDQRNLDEHKE